MGLQILSLTLVLLTQLVRGSQVVGTYNLMLDPGRIYWWKTKWMANPIDLSKSNAGTTGVTVTFNFNPSTSLTNGVFEVSFPGSLFTFTSSGANYVTTSVSGTIQRTGVTYLAGQDTSISFSPVTLPTTSAGYGPFAVRSRYATTGQVIDCNLSFGSIFVNAADGTITNFVVSYVPNLSSNVINRSSNTLSFKFNIAKEMWKYDFFKITVPSQFTLTMTNDFMCYSAYYGVYINNFNGTRAASPFYLDCVASSKPTSGGQTVYIYGLATDTIDVTIKDNLNVDLRVPGFTNPDRNYASTAYSWTIDTVRFGTTYTLESAKYTGPATTTDTFTSVSWAPTWGMSTQHLKTPMTIYMDMIVVTKNAIPDGGTIEYTTTATSFGSCALLTDVSKAADAAATTTFTITPLTAVPAGTSIKVRCLVQISATSPNTLSVTTKIGSEEIDKSTNAVSIAISSTASSNTLTPIFYDSAASAAYDKAGGKGVATLFMHFTVGSSIPAVSTTIYCPFSSAADDFQIYIPSVTDLRVHTAAITTTSTGTAIATSGVTKTNGSITVDSNGVQTTNPGSIKFTNSGSSNDRVAVFSSTTAMSLPLILNSGTFMTTGPRTPYECRIEALSGSTMNIYVGQFSITGQDATTATASFFCRTLNNGGTPLKVTFLPALVPLPASTGTRTYYLEIDLPSAGTASTFPTLHGSGVTDGSAYPMDSSLSTGATMIIATGKTNLVSHRVTGLGLIATSSSAVQIFFPVGTITDTGIATLIISLNTFFTFISENRTVKNRYYTHSQSVTLSTNHLATGVTATTSLTKQSGYSLVTGSSAASTSPLTLKFGTPYSWAITADTYFYIILPRGFTFSSLKDVQCSNPTAGSSFAEKRYFSSTSNNFAFPGVLVKQSFTGTQVSSSADSYIYVYGLVAPLGKNSGAALTIMHAALDGTTTSICATSTALTMDVITGTITTLVVSPSTVQARGPNGADVTMTIQATLPHGIDAGGSISFTVAMGSSSEWVYSSTLSSCEVSGLNSDGSGNSLCTGTGPTFTIKNFMGFETVTNQAITIYLKRLLPPDTAIGTSYPFVTLFTTTSSTNIGSGVLIDEYLALSTAIVAVTAAITAGQSTFQSIAFYPPNAGTIETDMYIMFTLPYDLPTDSIITITAPYATTSSSTLLGINRCWASPLTIYGCSVSTTITLKLAQKYQALSSLEIFVRRGFTTPTEVPVTTGTSWTVYGFRIKATWGDSSTATIIDDPAIASGSSTATSSTAGQYAAAYGTRLVVPSTKVTTLITSSATSPITFFPRNAGESATYTLSFKPTVAYADSDYLNIIWPDEFDPYVGDAIELLTQDPGNFYLTCTSTQLGAKVWCTVDHWVMTVKGSTAVAAASQIDLTVQGVRNPLETAATGSFRVLHYNVNNTLLEYTNSLGTVKVESQPAFLELRALNVTNRYVEHTSDYSMKIYGISSIDTTTKLQLQFPKEYDLTTVDQKDSYSCVTQWQDQTVATTTIKTPQEWNSGGSCDQKDNFVSMSAPTTAKTFTTASYIMWNITSVLNPLWGYPRLRTSTTQDLDIQDWDVWTVFSYWTSKFTVYTYSTSSSTQRYLAKSYYHASSAYLGFMQKDRTIIVNGFNPQDKSNRIVVWPGTQTTDLSITTVNSTWPLEAKTLALVASTNTKTPDSGALKYTSTKHNFVMLQEEWLIYFRVAASIDSVKGLYYIDWALTETIQPGETSGYYLEPTPTLVEIAPKVLGKYWFSISTVPTVTVGSTSVPIKLSLTNAPHSELIVKVAVQTINTVVPEPDSLTFRPDINELYFYLRVEGNHDIRLYPQVVVVFTLTGTDAAAFAIQPAIVVPIQSSSLYSSGSIAKLGVTNIAKTSVSIAPTTDQLGILYWLLQPKGSKILTFDELKALMPTLIKTESDFQAVAEQNAQTRGSFESDPDDGETWEAFQTRLYLAHTTTFKAYGSLPMVTTVTSTPVPITGLWADTSYQIIAYFDNLNNATNPATRVEYFDTLTKHDCQPVYVRFQYTVNDGYTDTVFNLLAKHLGVNPTRLVSRNRELQRSRELQSGTTTSDSSTIVAAFTLFSATILPNRAIESPTPTQIADLSNEAVDRMVQAFVAAGITNAFWRFGPLAIPARVSPMWQRSPQIQKFSNTTIIAQFLGTTPGKSCCVALLDTNINLQPEQVYYLYNYNWTQSIGVCTDTDTTQSINYVQITGLVPDTNYYVHCISTDAYPLWPTHMTYTTTLPIPFIPIHTPIDLELHYELEDARGLRFLLLGLLALFL